jgi:hypothetical protein
MNAIKSLTAAAVIAAGLTLGATPAMASGTNCTVVTVPAVPAVFDTVTTPPVTVTEYEFIQRNTPDNVPGQGAGTRWSEDPNWNAQGNLNSQGWTATGNTRVTVTEVERVDVIVVTPEIPARDELVCSEPTPDPVLPPVVVDTPAPPAPPAAVPAAQVEAPVPALAVAPAEAPAQLEAAPVAAQEPELAYTGYSMTALLWSLLALTGGAAVLVALRKFSTK